MGSVHNSVILGNIYLRKCCFGVIRKPRSSFRVTGRSVLILQTGNKVSLLKFLAKISSSQPVLPFYEVNVGFAWVVKHCSYASACMHLVGGKFLLIS